MANCKNCGEKIGIVEAMTTDAAFGFCQECWKENRREAKKIDHERINEESKRRDEIRKAIKTMIVTSTHGVDGHYIREYIGIESVEFVIGTGLFSEFTTSLSDTFGGRSSAFEQKLQAAKQSAFATLKYRAAEQGANAVVAVDMDFAEFSGNRVALILNGTLVDIVRLPEKK